MNTRRHSPRPRLRWLGVLGALTLVAPVLLSGPVAADPIATKKAQAEALAKQLQIKGDRVSALSEQMDQARLRAAALDAKVQEAQVAMAAADVRANAVREILRRQAVNSYMRGAGETGRLNAANAVTLGLDLAVQHTYVSSMASAQSEALDQVRASKLALDQQRTRLQDAKQAEEGALARVATSQKAAARAAAEAEAQLAKVRGDLATMVAAAQARQAAAEAARVQADLNARSASKAASRSRSAATPAPAATAAAPVTPAALPVAAGASGAVEEARRQLGKPYRYGSPGPDSFDCSGLTSWAWRAAGVSLPHSAAAQYHAVHHIPLDAIQPGDLLFYGADLHHEGIYVGGGQMIEAPHSGLNVRYASIYRSDLVGAGRP